jgi:hypothetical protein
MNLTDCRHNGVDQQQERAPRRYYGANATRKMNDPPPFLADAPRQITDETSPLDTLSQLHSELAGKLSANQRETKRLRLAIFQVEAVMKMLSPEVNIRLIAPKRRRESAIRGSSAGHPEAAEQPTGRYLGGATEAQGRGGDRGRLSAALAIERDPQLRRPNQSKCVLRIGIRTYERDRRCQNRPSP